jgi:hypothetical protein
VGDTTDPAVLLQRLARPGGGDQCTALPPGHHRPPPPAREARCHYFDLTEDVAATQAIQRLADGAPTAFMPQCGLAPGFIGIVAHHLAQGFDTLQEVKMRVGALPAFPTNALKYNLTWSVDGLINEYCHPCEAIHDGRSSTCCRWKGWSTSRWTAPSTRPSTPRAAWARCAPRWPAACRTLDYKSVRYPGHRALMKVLLEELQLKHDTETLKAIMRRSIPSTMQDVVLVFVTVSGLRGGVLVQEVFARKIFAERGEGLRSAVGDPDHHRRRHLRRGGPVPRRRLPQRGFVRQEQVPLPAFLANRFGRPTSSRARSRASADSGPAQGLPRPGHQRDSSSRSVSSSSGLVR